MSASPQSAASAPEPRRRRWGCLFPFFLIVLLCSLALNLGTLLVYLGIINDPLQSDPTALNEQFYLGDEDATDKIAVVRVTGVLTDLSIQHSLRQLETAARDSDVKAIVLRVNSPGGTVTASEELYQNILNVRDNTNRRFRSTATKPVHVSMGGMAASGGYYIATAGKTISAEPTTITGSIGVFVAIPNVAKLADEHGVKLELVKAGGMKASGSFFHELTPQERQTWQDVVDTAYDQFLSVIVTNRPQLTAPQLRDDIVIAKEIPERDEKGNVKLGDDGQPIQVRYERRRADGGTFTAAQARELRLIDQISDLPATIRATAAEVGLSSFKAVTYERTPGIIERLTGLPLDQATQVSENPADWAATLTPRLWYLAPSADAGLLQPH